MNKTSRGWLIFIGAMGTMCTLLAVDISQLKDLTEIAQPKFVGLFLAHIGATIGAFIGGKILPEDRDNTSRTRQLDMVALPKDIVAERKVTADEKKANQ